MPETPHTHHAPVWDPERFARVLREEEPRLVAYARSHAGHGWRAEDLVADAAFRVWRRLAVGQEVADLAAELSSSVRNLVASFAMTANGRSGSEYGPPVARTGQLVEVLRGMPERQVKAVWLVEVEGLPLTTVGRRLGTHRNAAAVLLHRARETMRQAFLSAQPGGPSAQACGEHWRRMPAHVRGADTREVAGQLREHTQSCGDCQRRLARLVAVDGGLPALVGPALVTLFVHGQAAYLTHLAVAGARGASTPSPESVTTGDGGSVTPFRFVRRLADRAFGSSTTAIVGVALASAVATTGTLGAAAGDERQWLSESGGPTASGAVRP